MKRGRDPKARTPRISPIACCRKAEGKPFLQFIIHIYLYLFRFPYNVWLFVVKNLSLLLSLNKRNKWNTRPDVPERVADGLSAGCGFSFDFTYQSCSTLIGSLLVPSLPATETVFATREPPFRSAWYCSVAISIDRAATRVKYTAREERFNRLKYVSLCHAKFRSRMRPFYANSK